jgi:hypothetical protein
LHRSLSCEIAKINQFTFIFDVFIESDQAPGLTGGTGASQAGWGNREPPFIAAKPDSDIEVRGNCFLSKRANFKILRGRRKIS